MFVHVVYVLVGLVIYSFQNLFVNKNCVFYSFLFLTVLVKRIEKTKNRVKSDLEATIKATDSKHTEFFSAIESADSKRKKMEFIAKKVGSATQRIKLKNRELRQALAKQKRLREIWSSFDHRENDLLNQKIGTIRALDELNFFSIDDNETELFDSSAEISINDYPELLDFDFSQFLKRFDFSSIPISAPATFQK